MTEQKKVWDEDSVAKLVDLYLQKNLAIEKISKLIDRPPRSVIAKLVQLKLYKKPEIKKNKITLKMLVNDLEKYLGIRIDGLNLSRKANLIQVVDAIKQLKTKGQNSNSNTRDQDTI